VTGGTFYRTYKHSSSGATGLADPATVSSFRLDKYDVTVGRFRKFVTAWSGGSGFTPPAGSGKHTHLHGGRGLADSASTGVYEPGWVTPDNGSVEPTGSNLVSCTPYSTWTASTGSHENLPINCVNWYEAYAFCIWDGGFLPSEAEGAYAAAGGSEHREYPWGTTDPGADYQYAVYNCYYPFRSGQCTGVVNIAPVGAAAFGAGRWGQLDLVGNVMQWNTDWHASYVSPCADCAYTSAVSYRTSQGRTFRYADLYSLPNRSYGLPTGRSPFLGLRCARTPQ
jgi:formylglycine-generating enzyme required for sulfatase activity